MSNNHLHPIFQRILAPLSPPDEGDGAQFAQTAEPPPPNPIVHLHMGGYHREADLMREAVDTLTRLCSRIDAEGAVPLDWPEYDRALEVIAKLQGHPTRDDFQQTTLQDEEDEAYRL